VTVPAPPESPGSRRPPHLAPPGAGGTGGRLHLPVRRARRTRAVRLLWLAVVLIVGGGAAWVGGQAVAWRRAADADLAAFDRWLDGRVGAYRAVPSLSDDETARLRRSLNATHVRLGQELGGEPVAERAALDSVAAARGLVMVGTDSARVVWGGRSAPYLTPAAAASLDSIAVRLRRRLDARSLPAFRYTLSSLWRSAEDQADLQRTNVNAARGRSSHEFATTYDLPYRRFSYAGPGALAVPGASATLPAVFRVGLEAEMERRATERFARLAEVEPGPLAALLGRVLIELEDEGVLVALIERLQPVYHVTVARGSLAEGAASPAAAPR
jgi:hypothetical protein